MAPCSIITSENSDLTQYSFIKEVQKPAINIYHYGVNCVKSTSTTITIDFGSIDYNCMTALIFTRYALVGFNVNVQGKGQVGSHNISNIVGYTTLSATRSGNKVTLTTGAWEVFEMFFTMSAMNALPTFTVS